MHKVSAFAIAAIAMVTTTTTSNLFALQENPPQLPAMDGTADIQAQPSHFHGNKERTIRLHITYPRSRVSNVTKTTGLLLSLHNWGGSHGVGAPVISPDEYDVIVIYVDYLDTGVGYPTPPDPPYDHGYYQALDAIRGLHFVYSELKRQGIEFDTGRLYCTGGSGGGNVALMANKLAPRTFACVVDLSGMASLTDDIAFNLPGGSGLKAGYSRDPDAPNYLSKDAQLIRDPGHPDHLAVMKKLGSTSMVVSIHGENDTACLVDDKKRVLGNMKAATLQVDPHIITQADVDGNLIKDCGHNIGSRTHLFKHFAGKYVLRTSAEMRRRNGKTDFEFRDENVVYPTPNGCYVISYKAGYPIGRFEPSLEQPEPSGVAPKNP